MKAIILEKTGNIEDIEKNLFIEEIPEPIAGVEEVIIKINYASLNHRDLWILKGQYASIKLPVILGSDGSGVIFKKGIKVTEFHEGDEVVINPSINWGYEQDYQNRDFRILGMPDNGTLAEYISINKNNVYRKPGNLNLMQSSAFPLAGLTAYRAVFKKGGIRKNDIVLITGIGGGVSTFAMLFCLSVGAKVYVTSGSEEKITSASGLGAKTGFIYKDENWDKKLITDVRDGITVAIDGTGGETVSKVLNLINYGGRIVTYGATTGNVPNLDIRKVFWKQIKIYGSTMGTDADFEEMIKFIEENNIVPVVDSVYECNNIYDAFRRMNSSEQFGKILVKM